MWVNAALWIWIVFTIALTFHQFEEKRGPEKPANGNSRHGTKLQLKQHVKIHDSFRIQIKIYVLKCLEKNRAFIWWLKPKNITLFYRHFYLEMSVSIYMFKKKSSHIFLEAESDSRSVMPDSATTHGLQSTWLLCPWNSLGKNTGVGCHSLLQGIFPIQGSNPISRIAGRFFPIWATREDHLFVCPFK